MEAVRGANVLMGTDRDCMTWIRTYRDHVPASATAAATASAGGEGTHATAQAQASEGGRRRGGREARRGRIGA
jgi:5-methyltetrahydrofolate--homocysteine methyltransferase